jgi:hypothetical protein
MSNLPMDNEVLVWTSVRAPETEAPRAAAAPWGLNAVIRSAGSSSYPNALSNGNSPCTGLYARRRGVCAR